MDGGVINQLTSLRLFQPLRQSALRRIASSPAGAPFGCGTSSNPKAVPACGGFEPSAPSGRCSEGRIGRNREYCKRQRCKTTIFQPAFVAANAMSRRKGNDSKRPSVARCSPSASLTLSSSPASGGAFNSLSQTYGLPAPSKREPFGRYTNSYVKPPSPREVDRLSYEVQQWKKEKTAWAPGCKM